MKTLFFFFTVFLLLLLELWIGTAGIYLPCLWMGFFYFAVCRYSMKLLFTAGVIFAILLDAVLLRRVWMPDIFICGINFYMAWRYRDFWQLSVWCGGFYGILLLLVSYIIQILLTSAVNGFSVIQLADWAAEMTALLPLGVLLLAFIIYLEDKMQKRLRFDSLFVADRQNSFSLYRRKGDYSK